MTSKAKVSIKIESGFLSALDECQDCGHAFDVASVVNCPKCNYHNGSDLAQEWINHCEEELNVVPAGVEVTFCHAAEVPLPASGNNGYWMSFDVSPEESDANDVMTFFNRIGGGSPVLIADYGETEQLSMTRLAALLKA